MAWPPLTGTGVLSAEVASVNWTVPVAPRGATFAVFADAGQPGYRPIDGVGYALTEAACVALIGRRRWPRVTAGVNNATIGALGLVSRGGVSGLGGGQPSRLYRRDARTAPSTPAPSTPAPSAPARQWTPNGYGSPASCARLGMTTTLAGALAFLGQQPGQSAADLARRARVTPQSAAKALNRLEQLGPVSRDPHPIHGRIQQVYLTEEGAAMLASAANGPGALGCWLCGESRASG
ncbi:MAG TPA: MarR family winged helix-turn-helix transcriptional regulator [Pseudonocardiaceae bacterium]